MFHHNGESDPDECFAPASGQVSNDKPELSADQQRAFDYICNNEEHCFLTGEAGSGKSYLTKALRAASYGGSVLCATTGQAAQVVGGRTIHSFIGLIPQRGLCDPQYVAPRIYSCKRLFIDEISMLSDVLFDMMIKRFEQLEYMPQLILIGDFLQLPPVDRDVRANVKHSFAFKSQYWSDIKTLLLSQQHRQSDPEFMSALNEIRVGNVTPRVEELLNSRNVEKIPDNCTMLFSTRAKVAEINKQHLTALGGDVVVFKATDTEVEGAKVNKTNYRFSEELALKPKARIIMLNNDPDRRWVNGSTGFIEAVKSTFIRVQLDNGCTIYAEPEKEELYNGGGTVIGVRKQYPLMLAKAVTIHKAQGMTLDRVGIGLADHFEYGQTYVALSRCKSKEGLFLHGQAGFIKAHPEALKFYQNLGAQ